MIYKYVIMSEGRKSIRNVFDGNFQLKLTTFCMEWNKFIQVQQTTPTFVVARGVARGVFEVKSLNKW